MIDLLISSGGRLVAIDALMSQYDYPPGLKRLLAEYGIDVIDKYEKNSSFIRKHIPDKQKDYFNDMAHRLKQITER